MKIHLSFCVYCIENKISIPSPDDVNLPNGITVFVKDHDCTDPIERLYYSCGYEPICIQCGWYLRDADEDDVAYPQCVDCTEEPIKKR